MGTDILVRDTAFSTHLLTRTTNTHPYNFILLEATAKSYFQSFKIEK